MTDAAWKWWKMTIMCGIVLFFGTLIVVLVLEIDDKRSFYTERRQFIITLSYHKKNVLRFDTWDYFHSHGHIQYSNNLFTLIYPYRREAIFLRSLEECLSALIQLRAHGDDTPVKYLWKSWKDDDLLNHDAAFEEQVLNFRNKMNI